MNLVETFFLFWLIGLTLTVLDHHDVYRDAGKRGKVLSAAIDRCMRKFATWRKLEPEWPDHEVK